MNVPKPKGWKVETQYSLKVLAWLVVGTFFLGNTQWEISYYIDEKELSDQYLTDGLSQFWRRLGAL